MGIDNITYIFIGRCCTDKEKQTFVNQLKDSTLERQEMSDKTSFLGVFEDGAPSLWELNGFPVVAHGLSDVSDVHELSDDDIEDIEFFVCQEYIARQSNRSDVTKIDYTKWTKPFDERFGMLMAFDVSY